MKTIQFEEFCLPTKLTCAVQGLPYVAVLIVPNHTQFCSSTELQQASAGTVYYVASRAQQGNNVLCCAIICYIILLLRPLFRHAAY